MQKRLRVMHVIPDLRKGGAERLAIDLCKGLKYFHDAECILVSLKPENEYKELSKELTVKIIPSRVVPSISGKGIFETDLFDALVDEFKPDVIHSHLFESELVVHNRLRKDVLYVSHLHDNMFQFRKATLKDFTSKKRITELYERNLILKKYSSANKRFIAISKDVKNYFSNNLPLNLTKQVILINNGFFFDSFYNPQIKNECNNPLRLVTIGSLVDKKNQAFLIPVVKYLNEKGLKVILNILGDGPNKTKLNKLIVDENLEDQIFLKGNVNNVPEYLHETDIYLHPATYEPFGLAILEAMSAGLPCICLNGRGNKDIISNGINGYIFESNQLEEFCQSIIQLTEDKKLYRFIATNGQNRSKEFDMQQYIKKIYEVYQS
jgi:glycosyltransferase involved in cell wall biosynthesis